MDRQRGRCGPPPQTAEESPLTHRLFIAGLAGLIAVATLSAAATAARDTKLVRPGQVATAAAPKLAPDGTPDETPKPLPIERGDSVAAIVNDTAISTLDVNQRLKLFLLTAGAHPDDKQMGELKGEILKQIETERIQLLEAQRLDITVSAGEVDRAIENILGENHLQKDKLNETLSSAGVHMSTLRGQIAAQIAWSKTVQARYGDEASVSPSEVATELRRLTQDSDKPRYRVSEIFMSVDKPNEADKVKKAMEDVLTQIRNGAPFGNVARTVSQNPTAAEGGDLGYVTANQLPPELEAAVKEMKVGQISAPVRGPGGYYLLGLREVQMPQGYKPPEPTAKPAYPPGTMPLARILLPLGPKPSPELKQRAMQAAEVLRSRIETCKSIPELVARLPGSLYMNLGLMDLSTMSEQIRTALANTTPGQVAQPFLSSAGLEIIARCDEAPPKFVTYAVPTRDEVENQLYQEQLSVLARRYMRDLRRHADIETR